MEAALAFVDAGGGFHILPGYGVLWAVRANGRSILTVFQVRRLQREFSRSLSWL